MKWKHQFPRIIAWSSVLVFALISVSYIHASVAMPLPEPEPYTRCSGEQANNFSCYAKHFTLLTKQFGPKVALENLKVKYARDPFVYSQCHQFGHVIGNTMAENVSNIADAFVYGDAICWSGYYHGVVERFAQMQGRDTFAGKADQLCAKVTDKDRFGFDYYNCVHGLGHGVMAITRNQLFEALDLCEHLSGSWEKRSCYGGVFMENVMVDNRGHGKAFLKPDDLLYPCNTVKDQYKEECYKMQTSYALTKNGYDFGELFRMCERADPGYERTCAQSIGRDASGQSVSDIPRTMAWCSLARNDQQAIDCYIGATKDYVSYYHSDVKARELCNAIPAAYRRDCEAGLMEQWRTMMPT